MDPFLQTLEGRPDYQRVTPDQAAGILNKSRATLDEWAKEGRMPPARITDDDGLHYYTLGEVRRFSEEALQRVYKNHPNSPWPLEKPPSKKELADSGLDESLLRGGRRRGVRHNNIAELMATGQPTDEWVFCMVATDTPNLRRPVDLVWALLHCPEELGHEEATIKQLSLAEYASLMADYTAKVEGAKEAHARLSATSKPADLAPRSSTTRS